MNCNQKRSKILKAATVYLGQGRKHIEHFGKPGGIQACRTQEVDLFSEEASEDERLSVVQRSSLLAERPFLPVGRAVGTRFPAELAGNSDRKETNKRVDGVYVNDHSLQEQHGRIQIKQDTKDDVPVEILGCPDSEGVRTDPDEQATECSSSFGYTDSFEGVEASDGQEVQSAPRDGNGALPCAVEDVEASDRRRKPLNMDWKNYRRGIEWRCRWLDLRLVELQQRAINYDQVLSNIQQKKRWETTRQASTSAVRACPLPEEHASQPILHRHRRRKVEETADVTAYMTKHPLFSRYEKKKREPESVQGDAKQQDSPEKDLNNLMELARVKQEESDVDEAVPEAGDQDSIEQIMWKVEALQARVIRLRNQLKGSTSHKMPGQFARGTTRIQTPKATSRPTRALAGALISSPATSKGSHGLRRRASDYDINNVVMSVSVGSKYVEHIRHVNIETPQWRFVEKVDRSELIGNASDEDTDDETYKIRHAPLELRERQNRYVPRSNKKAPDGGVASSSKSNLGRGEKILGAQTTPQCSISAQLNVKDEGLDL